MTGPRRRGRPAWEADLAARQARTPTEAAERARRGRALVEAALAGDAPPEAAERSEPSPPAGYEYVACVGCYRPVWGLPGSRCPACKPATPGGTP
ncbi:hypothetical protein GA0070622_0914 [Micromonospora sediminicola]|uniref:Uncharacterized protein n=1 Tax=Micromonospora sediminicola TaxID=946078 RepID=A0A1A9B4G1_9ACTN|nr:hypothetical protein [Micromonospora sediminicola]SBT63946.1 hypothetical protein GA0070622_0914 [Micromonospora sediminicola]